MDSQAEPGEPERGRRRRRHDTSCYEVVEENREDLGQTHHSSSDHLLPTQQLHPQPSFPALHQHDDSNPLANHRPSSFEGQPQESDMLRLWKRREKNKMEEEDKEPMLPSEEEKVEVRPKTPVRALKSSSAMIDAILHRSPTAPRALTRRFDGRPLNGKVFNSEGYSTLGDPESSGLSTWKPLFALRKRADTSPAKPTSEKQSSSSESSPSPQRGTSSPPKKDGGRTPLDIGKAGRRMIKDEPPSYGTKLDLANKPSPPSRAQPTAPQPTNNPVHTRVVGKPRNAKAAGLAIEHRSPDDFKEWQAKKLVRGQPTEPLPAKRPVIGDASASSSRPSGGNLPVVPPKYATMDELPPRPRLEIGTDEIYSKWLAEQKVPAGLSSSPPASLYQVAVGREEELHEEAMVLEYGTRIPLDIQDHQEARRPKIVKRILSPFRTPERETIESIGTPFFTPEQDVRMQQQLARLKAVPLETMQQIVRQRAQTAPGPATTPSREMGEPKIIRKISKTLMSPPESPVYPIQPSSGRVPYTPTRPGPCWSPRSESFQVPDPAASSPAVYMTPAPTPHREAFSPSMNSSPIGHQQPPMFSSPPSLPYSSPAARIANQRRNAAMEREKIAKLSSESSLASGQYVHQLPSTFTKGRSFSRSRPTTASRQDAQEEQIDEDISLPYASDSDDSIDWGIINELKAMERTLAAAENIGRTHQNAELQVEQEGYHNRCDGQEGRDDGSDEQEAHHEQNEGTTNGHAGQTDGSANAPNRGDRLRDRGAGDDDDRVAVTFSIRRSELVALFEGKPFMLPRRVAVRGLPLEQVTHSNARPGNDGTQSSVAPGRATREQSETRSVGSSNGDPFYLEAELDGEYDYGGN
ncbi:hypothetical protein BJ508DRAFT_332299 [Ascobolus immersus RN42]|uniref:Uncharacterized protein n=1 Tax=Ascobolus immersus RN42 TaxID=1160509 RepID=A0A3N4HNE8_ASCIM|nr:hypothetical protein BJ508DRAFT_332299 [Ascobolus immersus RN42]